MNGVINLDSERGMAIGETEIAIHRNDEYYQQE